MGRLSCSRDESLTWRELRCTWEYVGRDWLAFTATEARQKSHRWTEIKMGNAHFLLEEKFMRPNLLQIQLHTMLTLPKRHQGLQFCAEEQIEEGRKEGGDVSSGG